MNNRIQFYEVVEEVEGVKGWTVSDVHRTYMNVTNEKGHGIYVQVHSLTKDIVIAARHNERVTETVTAVGNNRRMMDVIAAMVDTFDAIEEIRNKGINWVCYVRKIKDCDL
ncbi:hypothetical protein [Bacillus thuringiensis]|uniref:hypothetical protein n=1 Tax=Bacillus thuringiensis TaxID=1428 RepID=UPI000A37C87C|nr:hypothetical protein [Bacillus thuringiensis]OTZ47922.1 hypothetical protein BK762_19760 [Bacillus thuringiensis serovar toumanoffi]